MPNCLVWFLIKSQTKRPKRLLMRFLSVKLTLFFILSGCGANLFEGPKKKVTPTNQNQQQNFQAQFTTQKCGQLVYEYGATGGNSGYFLYASDQKKYTLTNVEGNFGSLVHQSHLPLQACVYSKNEILTGYEGPVIQVEQISSQ